MESITLALSSADKNVHSLTLFSNLLSNRSKRWPPKWFFQQRIPKCVLLSTNFEWKYLLTYNVSFDKLSFACILVNPAIWKGTLVQKTAQKSQETQVLSLMNIAKSLWKSPNKQSTKMWESWPQDEYYKEIL